MSIIQERMYTMKHRFIKSFSIVGVLGLLVTVATPSVSRASSIVAPGFDLFETLPGTSFLGNPFLGVPLGTFNFGTGPVTVPNTDTIVHRIAPASAPTTTIPIEMVALHLTSANPINLGLGTDFYFVTLQSERGGPASTGSMTVLFGPEAPPGSPHGTFDSLINVFFDVRKGSLTGPIALSNTLPLTASGIPWNHFPPPGTLTINGVNLNLTPCPAGVPNCDFFPTGTFSESEATVATHVVQSARTTPEPAALLLLGFGLVVLAGVGRKRSFKKM